MEDDLVLLDRWGAGDQAAGNTLFKKYFGTVYRFFEGKIEGEQDDLVQETFLACMRGRDGFRRQSTFRTYLLAIARHTLFGYWRRKQEARQSIDFDAISVAALTTSIGTRMVKGQDRAALLAALRTLPVDQQLLLEMFYWEDLERDKLAEVFEVEEATIGSRLFRARKALGEALGAAPAGVEADFDAWAKGLRP